MIIGVHTLAKGSLLCTRFLDHCRIRSILNIHVYPLIYNCDSKGVENSAMVTAVRAFADPCKRMETGKGGREGGREGGMGFSVQEFVGFTLGRGLGVEHLV